MTAAIPIAISSSDLKELTVTLKTETKPYPNYKPFECENKLFKYMSNSQINNKLNRVGLD